MGGMNHGDRYVVGIQDESAATSKSRSSKDSSVEQSGR